MKSFNRHHSDLGYIATLLQRLTRTSMMMVTAVSSYILLDVKETVKIIFDRCSKNGAAVSYTDGKTVSKHYREHLTTQ